MAAANSEKPFLSRILDFFLNPPAVRAYADLIERDRLRHEAKEAARAERGEI